MERNIGNELKFSPTIDTKLLREAGVSLSSNNTILPGFVTCMCTSENRVFLIKRQ